MTPFFVADIGNTRIKCALLKDDRLHGFVLGNDEVEDWQAFRKLCIDLGESAAADTLGWPWTIAAVNPKTRDQFAIGLRKIGFTVRVLTDYTEVPIKVDVDRPERVGLDRLLSAAAITHKVHPGNPAAVISAGTAVTIDLVDSAATFRGGVILPGYRMMALALHEYTGMLPPVLEEFDPD